MSPLSSLGGVLPLLQQPVLEASKDIEPQSREWESSRAASLVASKMVSSVKSRGAQVTIRKGELVLKSIIAVSKAVSVRKWFRLRLWKCCICCKCFSAIPVVCCSGHDKLKQWFSGFNMYMNHLEIMLKCSFWFARSGVGPEDLYVLHALSDAKLSVLGLWVERD